MAVPNLPLSPRVLPLSSQPVVLLDSALSEEPHAQDGGGDVREENVHENVVEPALAEMRQNVLPGEFNGLIENVPEMDDIRVSQHESCEDPVEPVDGEIMVDLLPDCGDGERTIVGVDVHFPLELELSADVNWIKSLPESAADIRSLI